MESGGLLRFARASTIELSVEEFASAVWTSRSPCEGGEFHSRLVAERQDQLARLNPTHRVAAPSSKAAPVTREETREQRRLGRARAEAQRAAERAQRPAAAVYDRVIEDFSLQLLEVPNLPARVLVAARHALAAAALDAATSAPISEADLRTCGDHLLQCLKDSLDCRNNSLCEFTMALWKTTCDQAMSKFRPYERKTMGSSVVDVIRHHAAGTSMRKPEDEMPRRVAAEVLDNADAAEVFAHVQGRLGEALMPALLARLQELQSWRLGVMESMSTHPGDSAELQVMLAAAAGGLDPLAHHRCSFDEGKRAACLVSLATMSPLSLLSLLTSYVQDFAEHQRAGVLASASLWGDLLRWEKKVLAAAAGHAKPRTPEQAQVMDLLTLSVCCPKCSSKDTKQTWVKTRSDDEPFKFQIECRGCSKTTAL